MQSKRKSSWKILVVAAAANLLAVAAQAAPDAPHDASNSITCLTCHQMTSTYPKLLPPIGGTTFVDMDDTRANRVCRSCHDGSGSSIVLTDTHSSLTMGNKYGDWTVECWVCHNEHLQEQNRYNGSTYGMYIRRNINLANIKKPDGTPYGTGIKPVVFTGPATFADDISPYNGICEACHTKTTHFRNDGSGDDHGGKGGSNCVSCHNHDTGFTGGAVHNTFITDDSKTGDPATVCSGCHTNYATAPETAHSACAACHTTAPTLLDSTFPTVAGPPPQVDWDGALGSMLTNLTNAGYTFNGTTGRLNDPDGTDIAGVGGDGLFAKVKCGVCHAAKPDALAAVPAEHGGHPVTDWDYTAITNDCLDCHADGGKGTIEGVHSNTCTLCHVNPAGGDFTRKIGDAANGVDGDATLAVGRAGDCLTCHPGATYTKTKIHHDTANAVATPTNGCTTSCHNTTTGHAGNHNTLVAIQNPPCQGCHNAAAASGGNNVPVDATSGNLVHDYCTSCHVNPSNDLIATVATPTAHATTMNNADGTTATNNGGGTCTACHTAYFDGHGHAHTMSTVSLCANCHNAVTAPYTAGTEVHNATDANGCFTCHNSSTGALQGSAGGKTGGDCQNCHTAYFNGHSHAHTMPTVALCTSCHTATAAPYTGAGQVHAGSTCATCHDLDATPTGSLIGSATGKVGGENCQGCHTTYFDGHGHGGTTATPNHTQTLTKDALCGNCHGNGLSGPDAITAPYVSSTEVHKLDGCFTCHSPASGLPIGSAANWGATWGARANGTCVTCHTAGFAVHPHTHTFTATADCATCHGNNVAGSNARDAITAPFVGAGEVHEAASCATCHDGATGALKGSAIGHAAATGCIDCHINGTTTTWTSVHTTALGTVQPAVDHTTRVEGDAACTTCHGNPTPATSNARDAQATPYIVAGDVHATGCVLCHTGANNGALQASPTKADTVAKGTCTTCHTVTSTWTTIHDTATGAVTGVSHATRVDGLAACTTCHTATAGGAAGVMPYTAADDKIHDACSVCHTAAGTLNGGLTTYGGQAIAKGDCGTCHTATYFDSHTHHYSANNELSYNASVDLAQAAPGTACATCHTNNADATGTPLDSFTDILGEHMTGCARCHSYTNADGMNTPPLADNNAAISTAGAKSCISCHTPKVQPNKHGGHDATSFPTIDAACTGCHSIGASGTVTSIHGDNCTWCHASTSGGYGTTVTAPVANGRDGNAVLAATGSATYKNASCVTCHSIGGANVDAATLGGIHHDNKTNGVVGNADCASCHTVSGHEGDHTTLVSSAANSCATCHTGTAGSATGVPVNAADSKVHDACLTCHGITATAARDGYLLDQPTANVNGWVGAMPNGGAGTNNGGGNCDVCHTAYFNGHTHVHQLTASADCATCHNLDKTDGNAGNAITTPFVGATEVHGTLGCATCHAAGTGARIGSAVGAAATATCVDCHITTAGKTWTSIHTADIGTGAAFVDHATRVDTDAACSGCHGNPTPVTSNARDAQATPFIVAGDVHAGGCALCHTGANNGAFVAAPAKADTIVAGTCTTCHTATSTWTTIHDTATGAVAGVSHATRVDGLAACTTCHTATAGGAAGVMPYTAADDKVHDACSVCHTASGALNIGNTTYGGQPIAKGNCGTCHTATYFDNHVHGTTGGYVQHDVTYNATVDLAQAAPGTACATCHVPTGTLATWAGILNEHVTGCGRCHSYTNADGMNTPPLATNNTTIATGTGVTCVTCHTPKIQPATHGGHDASQFAWTASCGTAACHNQAGNPDVANDIHGNGTTATCTLCHSTASGGTGTTKVGDHNDGDATNGVSAPPHSAVECITCHNDVALGIYTGGIHHDTVPAATNSCDTCHDGTKLVQNHSVTVASSASCVASQCHTSATAGTTTTIQVSAIDGLIHNACISCHTFDANLSGILRAAPGTKGVTVMSNGGDDSRVDATPNGGGDCVACHYGTGATAALRATSRVTFHHTNVNTAAGNCDYCHYDHRPDSTYSTANVNAANGLQTADPLNNRVPTHLMCEECHVNPESRTALVTGTAGDTTNTRINGYAGGNVTVQAYNKGTDTYKNATTWRTFPTKSAVHTVPNTAGKIDNWGICVTCHDGTATHITGTIAATVNPGHAIPVNIQNSDASYCWDTSTTRGISGNGMALPGRRLYNNITNLNYYGDQWRPTASNANNTNAKGTVWQPSNGQRCGRDSGRVATQSTGNSFANGLTWTGAATSTLTAILIPNPWTGTQFTNPWAAGVKDQLPIFAYQAAATDTVPSIDIIAVVSEGWDGTKLDVTASVTNGNCTDLSLSTAGQAPVAFNASCQATINPYNLDTVANGGDGLTFNITSSQPSVDVMNYPITNNNIPVAATATADAFAAPATGGTVLDVLLNDTGSNLQVVVATVSSVTRQSGTGTCGSLTPTTANITYTGGGGNAVCTFTYQAQAYWTGTPYGAASQATVTVTQSANAAPVFGAASYNMANAMEAAAYTGQSIAGYATDAESDPITYSKVSGPAWLTVAANGALGGTPTTADVGANVFTVQASATGGTDTATLNITVDAAPTCGTASVLTNWTTVVNNATTSTISGSFAVPTGSNTSRLLVVHLGQFYGTSAASTKTVTYGGQPVTMVATSGLDTAVQRVHSWIGFCNEACLDAATSTTLQATVSGTPNSDLSAMVFDYVNQSNPFPSGGAGRGAYNDTRNAATTVVLNGLSYAANDWTVIGSTNQGVAANTLNVTPYTLTSGTQAYVWRRTSAATGNTTDNITITVGATSRLAGTAVAIQSECNNN